MKRILSVILSCTALLLCFSGCGVNDKDQKAKALYERFLSGELTASDKEGNEKYLKDFLQLSYHNDQSYTFIDMNSDGVAELCFRDLVEHHFFKVKENKVVHLAYNNHSCSTLLNNGALLEERHRGGRDHILYGYTKYDDNGNYEEYLEFSWWDSWTDENGAAYPESYYIGEDEVNKEEYKKKTDKFFSIGSNEIVWHDFELK